MSEVDTCARLGIVDFHEREIGFYYTNARRVGDNIRLRIHDILLPNFTQAGACESGDALAGSERDAHIQMRLAAL